MKEIKISGEVKLNKDKSAEINISVGGTKNCERKDVQVACKLFTDSLKERFDLDCVEIQTTTNSDDDDDEPKSTKEIVSDTKTDSKEAENCAKEIFGAKNLKEAVGKLNTDMELKLAAILSSTLGLVKQHLPEKKFDAMVSAIADTLNDRE